MKLKEITVSTRFEQKIATRNYENITIGSSLEIKAEVEEGEKAQELYSRISKEISKQVEIEVDRQAQEYLENYKKLNGGK